MTGRTVTRSDIRVPRFATIDLTGTEVQRVWPYGKHLFMQMADRVVHTHLKMEGVWSIHAAGARWRRPGYTARAVFRFSPQYEGGPDIEIVGHDLGFVRIVPAEVFEDAGADNPIAHLGPDILNEDWAVKEWRDSGRTWREEAIARILRRPERSLGAALLDQRNVAGIGNEYRAEVMFMVGLHPAVPVGRAGQSEVEHVLDISRRVMWENRAEPRRLFTGDRRPGMGNFVFGRAAKACRRCGAAIEKSSLGGPGAGGDAELDSGELERIIWWCPECQEIP